MSVLRVHNCSSTKIKELRTLGAKRTKTQTPFGWFPNNERTVCNQKEGAAEKNY
jgi:hypothetical protein